MEGVVTGIAFLSSTILLAKAIVIHQLALRDYLLYVRRMATAYYVESRLAFRDVKPHVALYVWIPAVALTAPLWPAALIAAAEPTYKFAANIKYSRYQDMTRMGRRELARGAIFTALPFSTTSLKPGRVGLQRCKALDALGGEMARGRPTSALRRPRRRYRPRTPLNSVSALSSSSGRLILPLRASTRLATSPASLKTYSTASSLLPNFERAMSGSGPLY